MRVMTKEKLRQKIVSAFVDVPYPGDDQIGVRDGRDDAEWATETFSGRAWESIQPHELERPLLRFMTIQSFHYYLPAYLTSYEDIDSSGETLIRLLTPLHLDDLGVNKKFFLLFESFTLKQKRAIYEFLKYEQQKMIAEDSDDYLLNEDSNKHSYRSEKNYHSFWSSLVDYWKEFSNS